MWPLPFDGNFALAAPNGVIAGAVWIMVWIGAVAAASSTALTAEPSAPLAGAASSESGATLSDLPAECRQQAIQPPVDASQQDETSRQMLAASVAQFERLLATIGQREPQWREYLLWPLVLQLAGPGLDEPLAVDRLARRWRVAYASWRHPLVQQTATAIQARLAAQRARAAAETAEQHAAAWNEIAELIVHYQSGSTYADRPLAAALETRERLGQAPRLIAAIRTQLAQPEIVLSVDRQWVESHFTRWIDEPFAMQGVVGGSPTSSSGRMSGWLRAGLVPSSASGHWSIQFQGASQARSLANDQGVTVSSHATTQLSGAKQFVFGPAGLAAIPATANASTSIVLDSVSVPGGLLKRRIASRQVADRRGAAERESAALAARSLRGRLDQEGDVLVRQANSALGRQVRERWLVADRLPLVGRIATDSSGIRGEWRQPLWRSLAAPPPARPAGPLSVAVSAAALENYLGGVLAGRTITPTQLGSLLHEPFSRFTPSEPIPDQPALEFAADPCEVRLVAGQLRIFLNLSAIETADARYPSATIEARYDAQQRGGQLALVRSEGFSVKIAADARPSEAPPLLASAPITPVAAPSAASPAGGLSGRRQTLQIALRRALERSLDREFLWPSATPDRSSLWHGMTISAVEVEGGWLQIGLASEPR